MNIRKIADLDSQVISRLKLSSIQHYIARTSSGDLYLTYKKDGNHQFFLDSVPLDKDTNKDLLNLYDGRLYTTTDQIDILGWLSRLDSEIQDLKDRPKNVNHGFDGFDPLPESDIPVHAVIARLKNLSPKKEKTRKVKEDNEVHLD